MGPAPSNRAPVRASLRILCAYRRPRWRCRSSSPAPVQTSRAFGDADQPRQFRIGESPAAFDLAAIGQAQREARSSFACGHFDFHQSRPVRLDTPPVIERAHRDALALAKLPPRQPAALELPEYPPDVFRTPPLFAHAAIFGQLLPLFKVGSLDAYVELSISECC